MPVFFGLLSWTPHAGVTGKSLAMLEYMERKDRDRFAASLIRLFGPVMMTEWPALIGH
jgi:hypothetical protein